MRNGVEVVSRLRYRVYEDNKSWVFYFYRKWFDEESKKLIKQVVAKFNKRNMNPVVTYKKAQYQTLEEAENIFVNELKGEGISVVTILLGKKDPTFVVSWRNGRFHLDLTDLFKGIMYPPKRPIAVENRTAEPCMTSEEILSVMTAFGEGKTIEKRFIGEGTWTVDPNPIWAFDRIQYRVKDQRMTNRDLAKWLAQGKGQVRNSNSENDIAFTFFSYSPKYDKSECFKGLVVRPWESDEWVEPSKELLDE